MNNDNKARPKKHLEGKEAGRALRPEGKGHSLEIYVEKKAKEEAKEVSS